LILINRTEFRAVAVVVSLALTQINAAPG